MSQLEKARRFANLHVPGTPLYLYNIWDAGGAKAIAEAGASAIATGSMSVAEAHGYKDGEQIPLDLVLTIVSRICETVDLPVTVDFEGGYSESVEGLARNVAKVIATGAIGINFEDQAVGGKGVYPVAVQSERIAAIRKAADETGIPLFINARTDLFLQEADATRHAGLLPEVVSRAEAFAAAGANGFFVPGLIDAHILGKVCEAVTLPVNAMRSRAAPDRQTLASVGIARVSCGPRPYFEALTRMKAAYAAE